MTCPLQFIKMHGQHLNFLKISYSLRSFFLKYQRWHCCLVIDILLLSGSFIGKIEHFKLCYHLNSVASKLFERLKSWEYILCIKIFFYMTHLEKVINKSIPFFKCILLNAMHAFSQVPVVPFSCYLVSMAFEASEVLLSSGA